MLALLPLDIVSSTCISRASNGQSKDF